jgi:hypothetical protein
MRVRTPMAVSAGWGKKRDEPDCRVAECIGLQHGIQLSGGMILRVVVLRDLLLHRPAGEEPRQALHGARAFYRCVVPGCRCDREAAPGARSANRPVRPGAGCGVISAGPFGGHPSHRFHYWRISFFSRHPNKAQKVEMRPDFIQSHPACGSGGPWFEPTRRYQRNQ